jgi:ketosteroid isomerase-like protein
MACDSTELVRTGFDAFLGGDFDTLRELMDPAAQWLASESGPWDCQDRETILTMLRERQREGVVTALADVIAGGEQVLVEVTGPDQRACMVVTVRNGLIVRMQDHHTREEALAGAGLSRRPVETPTRLEHTEPGWDEVTDVVAFVHVADLEASIAFYARLGFTVRHTFPRGGPQISWVWLENGRGRIMLQQAEAPIDDRNQGVLFYLYTRDLFGLRDRLVEAGVDAGEIVDGSPGPRTEMRVADPDGYVLMIAQVDWTGE